MTGNDQSVQCKECGASYPVEDGVHLFFTGDSSHGELSQEEMQTLISAAEEHGWEDALDRFLPPGKELVRHLIKDHRRHKAVELIEGVRGRVLDFGCGYGGMSRVLSQIFDEVVSVDGSRQRAAFLNVIRKQDNLKNISIACNNDVLNLPFPDNSFDAVVMVGVLEYLPQSLPDESVAAAHIKCLQSFLRILKPGGRLLIQTKNRFGWQYLLGAADHSGLPFAPVLPIPLADAILRLWGRGPYRIINHSFGGYRRLLRKAGFSDPQIFWPVPGYQVPDYVIDLGGDLVKQFEMIQPGYHSPLKRRILRAMAAVGLLRYVTPHYTLFSRKPS